MLGLFLRRFLTYVDLSVLGPVHIILVLLLQLLSLVAIFDAQFSTELVKISGLFDPRLIVANDIGMVEARQ